MTHIRTLTLIAGISVLTGCAGFGQAWREHAEADARLNPQAQTQAPPARNYFTDPILVPQPTSVQPSFGGNAGEQYQTIMVNTPQGIVYKRCRMLNGKAVACF